jgi:hypothetical protein
VPLDIVAVYSSANPATGAVTDLTTERQGVVGGTCPETTLQVPQQTLLFVPPHTGGGDRDFDGNGPCVNFDTHLRLDDDGTLLVADYHMQAFECSGGAPKSDFTAAEGSGLTLLASSGPGGRILGFSTASALSQSYTDTNHDDDLFAFGGNEPVSALRFVGDTDGDEAGDRTGVFITFRAMQVRMQTCAVPTNGG